MSRWLDWLRAVLRRLDAARRDEWRRVPPPNWACSRRRWGGDYW